MNTSRYKFDPEDASRFAKEFANGKIRKNGKELEFEVCPYCHGGQNRDTFTFSINMNTGQHNCFRASCGAKGNMIKLSKDFHFSLGDDIDAYYNPDWKKFKRLIQQKFDSKSAAVKYMKSRGISEAVTKRYGITTKPDSDNILIFPFRDENDTLQFIKYRNTTYKKGDSGNKEWCEADCKPILFGMAQCNFENKTLIMTEGQIDSLSVAEAGYENAVSVPTGKNGFTWVRYCWDFLNRFDTLIIFGDHERDEITLLDEMKLRFNGKVKHVRPEDYKDCKDANEILQKYKKEQVKACIDNAVPVPINAVIEMADVKRVNPQDIEKLPTGIKTIDDKLHGGLTFGNVHVLGGKRGDGKSTFGSQLVASALENGYSCFLYSGELLNWNVKMWLDYQLAGENCISMKYDDDGQKKHPRNWFIPIPYQDAIEEWYRGRCLIYDGESIQDDEREDLLKTVEEVIKQNVRVVLLDNLMTALDLSLDHNSDKYEKQSHFVKRLALLAKRYNACIILVAHRRKGNTNDSSDSNDEISGSGDITNLAGVVLSYDRLSDKDKKDGKGTDNDRKLIIAKERLFGNVDFKGIVLHYEEYSKRIYETEDELNYEYGWWKRYKETNNNDGFIQSEEFNPFEEGFVDDQYGFEFETINQ